MHLDILVFGLTTVESPNTDVLMEVFSFTLQFDPINEPESTWFDSTVAEGLIFTPVISIPTLTTESVHWKRKSFKVFWKN